jgi:hypothetical protein
MRCLDVRFFSAWLFEASLENYFLYLVIWYRLLDRTTRESRNVMESAKSFCYILQLQPVATKEEIKNITKDFSSLVSQHIIIFTCLIEQRPRKQVFPLA